MLQDRDLFSRVCPPPSGLRVDMDVKTFVLAVVFELSRDDPDIWGGKWGNAAVSPGIPEDFHFSQNHFLHSGILPNRHFRLFRRISVFFVAVPVRPYSYVSPFPVLPPVPVAPQKNNS